MKDVFISDSIVYVGVDDKNIDLFESQYVVPNGVSYNSYVILDDKITIMDTVDRRGTEGWLANLKETLGNKKPYYVVVSHLEPDHAGNLKTLLDLYPDIKVIGNPKTFTMIAQFFDVDLSDDRKVVVSEGDTVNLGTHTLQFFMAPLVHWPEVMVAYEQSEKILFSADGFGKFGALDADEPFSAGNTGALLTGATLKIRRIKGVRRAALGAIIPLGSPTMLADAGAQTDCTPENLVLFAVMGSLFMEKVMGIARPKVALINNGAEEHKGTPLQSEAYQLLKADKDINFIGNIEGREIPEGNADVLVADGFTGNIVLKMCEGLGIFVKSTLKKLFYRNALSKVGALFVKGSLDKLKKEMDYSEYGGAPFLGIAKPVIKAHGSSNAKSISYCVLQAKNYATSGMIDEIARFAAAQAEKKTDKE